MPFSWFAANKESIVTAAPLVSLKFKAIEGDLRSFLTIVQKSKKKSS